jgi:hypothetical protein
MPWESARSDKTQWTLPATTPNYAKRRSAYVNRLAALRGGVLGSADLAGGFEFDGQRIPLINPQRGIFKPRKMEYLLSIKTVFPRRGARVWYDDQREAHRQIYAGDDVVEYQFMGSDLNSPDNRWLLDAMQQQITIIYFLGTSPGRYQPTRPSSSAGIPSACACSLPSGRLSGRRQTPHRLRLPKGAMRSARSRRGSIRRRSGTQCSQPTTDGARSLNYRSRCRPHYRRST